MGEPINFINSKKKVIMKIEGGDNMLDLFKHKYDQVVEKIKLTSKPLGYRTAVICICSHRCHRVIKVLMCGTGRSTNRQIP